MKILYKNKNLIAVSKPAGIPVQHDSSGDEDLMSATSRHLRSLGESDGLWLVHRLDRVVGGVVVFARNKHSAATLSELFATRGAEKEYLAVVEGRAEGGLLEDYLSKDERRGMAVVADSARGGAKAASLEYSPIECVTHDGTELTLVRIKLHTGRFHQIRAQFSSRGMPIVGDGKYGSRVRGAHMPALFSFHIGFNANGGRYDIYDRPDVTSFPWSLFDIKKFEELS